MKVDEYGAWPHTEEELLEAIRSQLKRMSFASDIESGYNLAPEVTAEIALAAFNYAAHVMGISGFQASFADLRFIQRTRGLKGPFAIIDGENLLYPQYDLREQFEKYMREWPRELKELAQQKLDKDDGFMHPNVRARMQYIASL